MLPTLVKKRALVPLARACSRYQSTTTGPNDELIQMLTRHMEEEKAATPTNPYKVRAYTKAINAISELPEQVRSVDQLLPLEGIGSRIMKRIEAHLSGTPYEPPSPSDSKKGKQKTLEELRRKQMVSALTKISGIGPIKANALYDAGCKSFQDLVKPSIFQMLKDPQRTYAQYVMSLEHRVTHEQASTVRDFVSQNISSKFTVLLGGELRRGASSAQHITFLILHPQHADIFPPEGPPSTDSTIKQRAKYTIIPSPFADRRETKVKKRGLADSSTFSTEIICPLECRGLLATSIANGPQRWEGVVRIPERTEEETEENVLESRAKRVQAVKNRQGRFAAIEIYYVPHQCAGAAMIALTGDTEFNVAIRRAASQLGLRLNEYGLWKWKETATTTSVDDVEKRHDGYWELIASEKEEEILEAVRMEWVPPERRNFANLERRRTKQATGDDRSL